MANELEFTNRGCERYEERLEDYLSGELSAQDAKSLAEHCQTCDACRTALNDAAGSVRLLRVAEPSADPGVGFARMVAARIREAESERRTVRANYWQPFVALGWRFAATATLALVVFVTYSTGRLHRAQPNVAAVRPTEGIDIFAPEPAGAPVSRDEVLMMVADNGHAKF